jgi:hypothetical protein
MLGRAVAAQLERLQLGPHGPFVVDDVRDVLRGLGVPPRLQEPEPVACGFGGMSGGMLIPGQPLRCRAGGGLLPRAPRERRGRQR